MVKMILVSLVTCKGENRMIIGYARVSKETQSINRQLNLLKENGAEQIIQEKMTGTKKERPGIDQLILMARSGDQVVVESLSRLGRKTLDILQLIEGLEDKGISFVSIKEHMNTTTPTRRAMLQMMSVIAELERNLIAERIKEGLNASRKRGTHIGRPKKDPAIIKAALKMYDSEDYSVKEITKVTNIAQGTLYRAINERKLTELEKLN